jgi:putative zinc finger protein
MEHEQIAEQNVVERYLMGRLAPEEEELFEEHLLECADCRRQVEWEEDFQGSLHTVAAEEVSRTVVRVGLLAWIARHRGWLLAAAVLLLAVLPIAGLLREQGRLSDQIARLEAAASQRNPQPIPTPTPAGPDPQRQALEAELRTERDARTRLAEQIVRLTQPQVNTPIFSLGLVRGSEQAATRIDLGRDPEWIVLSVELPAEAAPSYRAALTTGDRTVWKGAGLKSGADGTVAIALYSTLLEPGLYKLRLEAVDAQGHGSPAGEIPFRVAR